MMAFERIEPFGGLVDQALAGRICATVANSVRDSKTQPDAFQAADFMPHLAAAQRGAIYGSEPERLRGEELDAEQLSALLDAELFGRMH